MHASIKRSNLYRSIKKFFWDNLYTTEGYNVAFDKEFSPPGNVDNWINILLDNVEPNVVSVANISVYIFTRKDTEGDKVTEIRDSVMNYLISDHMDLYDDSMTKFGGAKLYVEYEDGIRHIGDDTKMISIVCTLRWGGKW